MAQGGEFRGLLNFIKELKQAANPEAEQKRIDVEMAKIREAFTAKQISSYDKKKYLWKLQYIYMLGYNVEFGHKFACDLASGEKYSEKAVGYTACAIMLNENHEFMKLLVNSVSKDLQSKNDAVVCLALTFLGSVGGKDMAESVLQEVQSLLVNPAARTVVRKKAALCLLRLYKKLPKDAISADVWAPKFGSLLAESNIGLVLCVATLLLGVVARTGHEGYDMCMPQLVEVLHRLINRTNIEQHYCYYNIACPWLQVKCLRILQHFPVPSDSSIKDMLTTILHRMVTDLEGGSKNNNRQNALYAILFEATSVCLSMGLNKDLLVSAVDILSGKFLNSTEANLRYLALSYMQRLAVIPELFNKINDQRGKIQEMLRDPDVSIRRRSLDLLFTICDSSTAEQVVDVLINYIPLADFSMREELVLKVAILAERFAPRIEWYVDNMLTLMDFAGDEVSSDIWQRVVQLVANNDGMQPVAVARVLELLQHGSQSEPVVCVAACVLGEYGVMAKGVNALEMFKLLHNCFRMTTSTPVRALLLTAFLKLFFLDAGNAEVKKHVTDVLDKYSSSADAELQQRAVEYKALAEHADIAKSKVFLPMPKWPEKESSLITRLIETAKRQEGQEGHHHDDEDDMRASREIAPPVDVEEAVKEEDVEETKEEEKEVEVTPEPEEVVDLLGLDADPIPAAAATAAHAAQNGGTTPMTADVLELLADGYGSGGVPHAQAAAAQPSAAAQQHNPFAIPPEAAAQPSPPAQQAAAAVNVLGDLNWWWTKLIIENRGVLYEDDLIQIGMQMAFQEAQGQITFFLGNKMQQPAQLTTFSVTTVPGLLIEAEPHPATIDGLAQIKVSMRAICDAVFTDPPVLQLAYSIGAQQVQQSLTLPIVISKFMAPKGDITAPQFYQHWQSLVEPMKQSEMIVRTAPLTNAVLRARLETLGFGAEGARNRPQPVEPNAVNECGAGVLATRQGIVGCMTRVEVNPSNPTQMLATVATRTEGLSRALLLLIKDVVLWQ